MQLFVDSKYSVKNYKDVPLMFCVPNGKFFFESTRAAVLCLINNTYKYPDKNATIVLS